MATPAYVNLTNFVKGVSSAQAALNIATQTQTWENPKELILDRFGGRTGWAEDFDISSPMTITGETSTATVAAVAGAAWATALTLANADAAIFGVTGGQYMESISIEKTRDGFQNATLNTLAIGGIT